MKQKLSKSLIALPLTLIFLLLVHEVEAGRGWAGGDSRLWSVQKTCVNGGLIMGIHSEATSPDWDPSEFGSSTTTVTPYLIDRSPDDAVTESLQVIFPDGTPLNETRQLVDDIFEIPRYYSRIGETETHEIIKEATPLQAAATSDTLQNYYGYLTDGKLRFHRDLAVGDLVYYSIRVIDTVQDCRIEELSSTHETDISLSNPARGVIPNSALVYTIEQSADLGTLAIGSTPLTTDDTFTHADLESQSLIFSGEGGGQTIKISSQATYRASVNGDGSQLSGRSWEPSISGDGKVVAFTSLAVDVEDLNDTNGVSDVFKRTSIGISPLSAKFNFSTREYEMGDGQSSSPDIAPNGLYTAFASEADNFVSSTACPQNKNIFVVRSVSDIAQMSCASAEGWTADDTKLGADNPSLYDFEDGLVGSSSGVYQTNLSVPLVIFDQNNQPDVVGFNTTPQTFSSYTQATGEPPFQLFLTHTGNGGSRNPQISYDGKHVVFESDASNLVSNDTNNNTDIIVSSQGAKRRMSLNSAGEEANSFSISPAISRFGEHVTFASAASNLASDTDEFLFQVYVRDRNIDGDELLDEAEDVCTVLVSKSSDGTIGNDNSTASSISADGRLIAFISRSDNLVDGDKPISEGGYVDIFVHDRDADGDGSFYSPSTADDRCTPGPFRTIRVSVDSYGNPANGHSSSKPDISANGDFVAFASDATNLVPGDSNGVTDVFVHYLGSKLSLNFAEPSPPVTDYFVYLPYIHE